MGEMVMVWTKEFDLAEWDGQRFVHRYSPGLCVLTNVKHWRRLPMPPGAKEDHPTSQAGMVCSGTPRPTTRPSMPPSISG